MEFYYRLSGKLNQREKKRAMIDDNELLLFFSLRSELLSSKNEQFVEKIALELVARCDSLRLLRTKQKET